MVKIYNTRTRKKEEFKPFKEDEISMYVCGPTVYDSAHLGHGRSAVSFDVIRKYFEYRFPDYKVKFVSNYTDIDDKMINRAKEKGISVAELAAEVIPIYEEEYGKLGIKKPTVQPRATEQKYIDAMIEIIKLLEKNGFTYVLDDGVYYDVEKYEKYGQLSGQKLADLRMGARVDVNEKKKNPYDFVLWKFKKEGEPAWESPWGDGRPGWHIECSAMSWKNLGITFDIHGGGLDLVFPHHECEIAQSKAALGDKAFARYWMHNGFINVDNEKMSKSLGNFFTLKDIFRKYDPQVVRLMFLQTHYRNPINFSDALLNQAKNALATLHDFVRVDLLKSKSSDKVSPKVKEMLTELKNVFESFMDNDFDTSGALGAIFSFRSNVLGEIKTSGDIFEIKNALESIDKVLGIIFTVSEDIPQGVLELSKSRDEARKSKDFKKSDELREELRKKGYEPMDLSTGTVLKKL